jgi:hypothetical protein
MIYLTAIELTHGGSSTVHIYTQTIHRTTQRTQTIHRTTQRTQTIHRTTQFTNWEECGPCPVFARYTLAFALQPRKKHGKTSVRVAGECSTNKLNRILMFF